MQVLINLLAVSTRLTERGHVFLCVRLAPDGGSSLLSPRVVIDLGGAPPGPTSPQAQEQQQRARGYQPSGARGPPGWLWRAADQWGPPKPCYEWVGLTREDQVSEAGELFSHYTQRSRCNKSVVFCGVSTD